MSTALVKPTTERDALAIIGASDDRELLDAAGGADWLPRDCEFEIEVEAVECKARKNYDNQGIFFTAVVRESNKPEEIPVNKQVTVAWFDKHPTIPPYVIAKMMKNRRDFAAVLAGKANTKGEAPDESVFKSAPVLLKLHQQVEPLGFRIRIKSEYSHTTRKGKDIYETRFARVTQ